MVLLRMIEYRLDDLRQALPQFVLPRKKIIPAIFETS